MAHNRSRDRNQMTAIMISAIEEFEEHFGYLWGHDLESDAQLDDNQEEFLDLWYKTREKVLDRGNYHINRILEYRRRFR